MQRYKKLWKAEKRGSAGTNGDDGSLLVCVIKLKLFLIHLSQIVTDDVQMQADAHKHKDELFCTQCVLFVLPFLCDLVIHPLTPSICSSLPSLVVIV